MGSMDMTSKNTRRTLEEYGVVIDAFEEDVDWTVNRLSKIFPSQIIRESSEHEKWKASSFWSVHQRVPCPAAIFLPKSAKEVAIALLICKGSQCKIAVKSGGHAAMMNASSVDDGVVIDLKNLNTIELNDDKSIAYLGTGCRWGAVYQELAKHGLAVAGGRAGDVGVGGYTLGGGISFFASVRGWGCDTVRNYELVTADGDIISVNRKSYPDLYWALRGGGNNFGIVTRFDYETFSQGDIFAGSTVHGYEHRDAVIKAFSTFANHGDPKAATWLSIAYTNGQKIVSALAMHADPEPNAPALKPYMSIPTLYSTVKVRSIADMVHEVAETNVKNHRQSYENRTFKFDVDFVLWIADMYWCEIESAGEIYESGQPFAILLQVFTKEAVALMQRNGGNCLGLKEEDAPYLNVLIPSAWYHEKDNEIVAKFVQMILGRIVEEGKMRGLESEFIYMNYASANQNVLRGYGKENYDRLRAVADKYDPEHVFQKLMPGYFKLDGAQA